MFKEVVPVQIANPQLTLSRLAPHTQYTFKVCIVAVCAHKRLRGAFSELSNITTEEAGTKCKLNTHNVIVCHRIQSLALIEYLALLCTFPYPCVSAPGPVASFSGSATSPTDGVLLWTPPLSPNGIITGYNITSSTHSSTSSVVVSSATRSYKLSSLHRNTQYTFTVAAVNGAGQGQAATVTIHTW